MCGIFGYIGKNNNAVPTIVKGLKRLEYRGYDSWGVAVINNDYIALLKHVGEIGDVMDKQLKKLPKSTIGIGHTRWATHGAVTNQNAHPHASTNNNFVLAHNGIVENFKELKKEVLKNGYKLQTQTDTEVIVRLIEEEYKRKKDLLKAVNKAFLKLTGRNTIILMSKNKEIIAARNGSPLVVGKDQNNTFYISSDTLSFAPYTNKVLVVENGQIIQCKNNKINLFDIKSTKKESVKFEIIQIKSSKVDKEGYDHFMLKEIYETPYVINQIISQDKKKLDFFAKKIKSARNVYVIGSGTAGVASMQIAYYLRKYGSIHAYSLIGAEAQSYFSLFSKRDIIIAPSQSGETADVLEVLEFAKKRGVKIASLVNMQGSMMTRISDFPFMCNAGPEICVMTTKVLTSQISWGYLLSKILQDKYKEGIKHLKYLSLTVQKYLKNDHYKKAIKKLAKKLAKKKHIFLLAKGQNLAIIAEGMIKIIESSYIHAHAIPAGDLKHYAITLMEKGTTVIAVISLDEVASDVNNAITEVRAREAEVISISSINNEAFKTYLTTPNTGQTDAISNLVTIQLLAYYMALSRGTNIDRPRNIAKSVTVK